MIFPILGKTITAFPFQEMELGDLVSAIRSDAKLSAQTEAKREVGTNQAKLEIFNTTLGGPYVSCKQKALCPNLSLKPSKKACGKYGYRNTAHIDWERRTGIVSVDMDGIPEHMIEPFRIALDRLPQVVLAWVSARRKGFKIGVRVDPIPVTQTESWTAWAKVVLFLQKHMPIHHEEYRIDQTKDLVRVSILAHDPDVVYHPMNLPFKWDRREVIHLDDSRYKAVLHFADEELLAKATGPQSLRSAYDWEKGARSNNLCSFGSRCAISGYDYDESLAVAWDIINTSGMLEDYGEGASIRNFNRGFQFGDSQLLEDCGFFSGETPTVVQKATESRKDVNVPTLNRKVAGRKTPKISPYLKES